MRIYARFEIEKTMIFLSCTQKTEIEIFREFNNNYIKNYVSHIIYLGCQLREKHFKEHWKDSYIVNL